MRVGGLTAAVALLSLASAPVGAAAASCVTEAQLGRAVHVILPAAIGATLDRCVPLLARDAYLVRAAPQLRARFPADTDAAETVHVLGDLVGTPAPRGVDEAALSRAFIGGVIDKFGIARLTARTCGDVSRILEPLDPLPRASAERLVTVTFALASGKGRELRLCPAPAPGPR